MSRAHMLYDNKPLESIPVTPVRWERRWEPDELFRSQRLVFYSCFLERSDIGRFINFHHFQLLVLFSYTTPGSILTLRFFRISVNYNILGCMTVFYQLIFSISHEQFAGLKVVKDPCRGFSNKYPRPIWESEIKSMWVKWNGLQQLVDFNH